MAAVFIGCGQIVKNQLQGAQCQTVGVAGGHHGSIGLQSMGYRVNAGGGSQSPGCIHHHVRVHNGHVGHQLVVGKGVLDAALLIGNDREGRHLGAGAGGGGNGHKIGLFTHLGELVHTLADVAEAHGHVHEIGFGMLVEHPHDFRRVHGRTTAHRDDDIRLEGGHLSGTGFGAGQGGIRFHGVEGVVNDAHGIQLLFHRLGVAILIQEGIGDNEGLFVLFQLGQRNGQAALLEIYLFGRTEPEHIFPSFCHRFDVQQVLDAHVFGNTVAAPAAAAKGQRGRKLKIVQITDAALRGGRIDQQTAGLHAGAEGVQLFLFVDRIQIHGSGMTEATVFHQPLRLGKSILKGLRPVHGKDGGQLLVGKGFAQLHTFHFPDEDLGGFGHFNARKPGDGMGGLADDFRVQRAADQDGFPHLLDLFFR